MSEVARLPPSMPSPTAESVWRTPYVVGIVGVDNLNMGVNAAGESKFEEMSRKRGRPRGAVDARMRKKRCLKGCCRG